jgi:thymidine kinase
MTPGVLEVITGPMFSGKSEELIRRLKRARIARQRVACYKPAIDARYHRTSIASHSQQTHDACTVTTVEDLRAHLFPQIAETEVVGIDEVQFLAADVIPLVLELVAMGKRVIIAGLDTTFANEPFGPVPDLMALADKVTKLSAVCMVFVGAAGMYEARCRAHFSPHRDEHGSEQLELVTRA